ncbi:MAG: FkbM family methyltransferase [Sulfuritalea sp.]|nr:FkbM family methyltransferase [Sulfuritalea sp.]
MQQIKKAGAGLLARLTGNSVGQTMLGRIVFYANYLMGIGAGAHTSSSGEVGILRNLYSYGKAPFTIFDVGANQGQFLRMALREIDPTLTRIHCFEPSKAAFAILSNGFAECRNVCLNNFGLAASQGEAVLYSDEPASGLASLTQRRLEHFGISHDCSEAVMLETVDAYCDLNGIHEITLLKIDVEGMDSMCCVAQHRWLLSRRLVRSPSDLAAATSIRVPFCGIAGIYSAKPTCSCSVSRRWLSSADQGQRSSGADGNYQFHRYS